MSDVPPEPPAQPREDTLLVFPTDFPVKIMGQATADFRSLVLGIVTRHFGELEPGASKNARAPTASTCRSR
jgi:uncharacterized protein